MEKSSLYLGDIHKDLDLWFDLIEKMVTIDFRNRISAKKALEHPFF
jgi:serine/threonine protein kinase